MNSPKKRKLKTLVAAVATALALPLAAGSALAQCKPTPLTIGPINNLNGFPLWIQDSNGVTLQQCLQGTGEPDGVTNFCFFDPVIPGNLLSEQIGFGPEAFWWLSEAVLEFGEMKAVLVMGAEAAWSQEVPIDGTQFPFARFRLRANLLVPGLYKFTHPYGVEEFYIAEISRPEHDADMTLDEALKEGGRRLEVNETIDIPFPTKANPNDTTVFESRIGPFLTFDPATDAPAGYVGDGGGVHRVKGSPCGTNFFRIDGPPGSNLDGLGNDFIETDQFSVVGQQFNGQVPTALKIDRVTYRQARDANNAVKGRADLFATSVPNVPVVLESGVLPATTGLAGADGRYFKSIPLSGDFAPGGTAPTVAVSADGSVNPETANLVRNVKLTKAVDEVIIDRAEYDTGAGVLTIQARSGDEVNNPRLSESMLGEMLSGVISVTTSAPPAAITVRSTLGGSSTVPVQIVGVEPAGNSAPVANADQYTIAEDQLLAILPSEGLLANDLPEDKTGLTVLVSSPTTHGTLGAAVDGSLTYMPNPDYFGSDSFTYRVRDAQGALSDPATVTITVTSVNDAPVARDDSTSTLAGRAVSALIVANDSDAEGGLVKSSVVVTTPPSFGTVTVAADGMATYTPTLGYSGTDTFSYTIADNENAVSAPATVSIKVDPVPVETLIMKAVQFRVDRNQWKIIGTSDVLTNNAVTAYLGPVSAGIMIGSGNVDARGTFEILRRFSPPSMTPTATSTVTLVTSKGTVLEGLPIEILGGVAP